MSKKTGNYMEGNVIGDTEPTTHVPTGIYGRSWATWIVLMRDDDDNDDDDCMHYKDITIV